MLWSKRYLTGDQFTQNWVFLQGAQAKMGICLRGYSKKLGAISLVAFSSLYPNSWVVRDDVRSDGLNGLRIGLDPTDLKQIRNSNRIGFFPETCYRVIAPSHLKPETRGQFNETTLSVNSSSLQRNFSSTLKTRGNFMKRLEEISDG